MKKAFFIPIIALMLVLFQACGDGADSSDEENAPDTEINDEMQSDADEEPVNCTDEWEKAEMIDDPQEYYGFKISTVKRNWNWKTENGVDTFSIMTSKSSKPAFMHVTEEGNIILIGSLNGETCAECFNEFMHVYKPDGTYTVYGLTGLNGARAEMAEIDETTGETVILFSFSFASQENGTYINQDRYFTASFKDTSFKFKAWRTNTDNVDICDNFFVDAGNFYLLCMSYYSEDGTLFDRFKTRIVSGFEGAVYYKTSSEDSGPVAGDLFRNSFYVMIAYMDNDINPYLQEYSNATLCMEEQTDNIWSDKPVGFGNFKYTDDSFFGFSMVDGEGPDEGTENELGIVTVSGYGSVIYIEKQSQDSYLVSAGILSRVDNKGHRTIIRDPDQIIESDGSVYAATSATGDYDGDGSPTDEELAVIWENNYDTSFSSYITAVDSDLNAYVKEIKNGLPNSMAFKIAEFDKYLYVFGINSQIFDPESIEKNIFISRVKKDSIIKEENLVSEKSVRIQKFE